ncbi:Hypothetical protein GLP15_3397 [Giardia lamblia P15]|uniref:Uncharacterized protein n=1 Tax=Giardia intestinalis (strain P15) TaxID=658858 RepID=E1EVZ3_GIAIA|nr:Hypothetical protein GLP15_3397 [Giardia lamblia P15]
MQDVIAALEASDTSRARTIAWDLVGGELKYRAGRAICYCAIKDRDVQQLAAFVKLQPDIAHALPFERAYLDFVEGRDASWFLEHPGQLPAHSALKGQICLNMKLFKRGAEELSRALGSPLNLYAAASQCTVALDSLSLQEADRVTCATLESSNDYGRLYQFHYNRALYHLSRLSFEEALIAANKAMDSLERHVGHVKCTLVEALGEQQPHAESILDATRCRVGLLKCFTRIYAGHDLQDAELLPLLRRIKPLKDFHPSKKEIGLAESHGVPFIDPKDPYTSLRMAYKSMIVVRDLNFGARQQSQSLHEALNVSEGQRRRNNKSSRPVATDTQVSHLLTGHAALHKHLVYVREAYIDEEPNTPEFTDFLYAVLHLSSEHATLRPPQEAEDRPAYLDRLTEGPGGHFAFATWLLLWIARSALLPYTGEESTRQQRASIRRRFRDTSGASSLPAFDHSLLFNKGSVSGLCNALLELGFLRVAYDVMTSTLQAYTASNPGAREHAEGADEILDCLRMFQREAFLRLVRHNEARTSDYEQQGKELSLETYSDEYNDAYLPELPVRKRESKPLPEKWQPRAMRNAHGKAQKGKATHQGAVTDRTEVSAISRIHTKGKRRR